MLEILLKLFNIAVVLFLNALFFLLLYFLFNFIKTKIFRIKNKTTKYKIEDRYPDKRKWNSYDGYDDW